LEEGEVVIPEITLMWWNAGRKKVYKRTLREVVINVQPNPDLGMVTSIKDSLDAMVAASVADSTEEEKPFEFLGMNWKQLSVAILLLILLIKYGWKFFQFIWKTYQTKHRAYLESEKYYFDLFLKSLHKSEDEKLKAFYRWLDCLTLKEYTLDYFSSTYIGSALTFVSAPKQEWIKARKRVLENKPNGIIANRGWINP